MAFAHCLIIFPFPGLEENSSPHRIFLRLIEQCRASSSLNPTVVYDSRSQGPRDTPKILKKLKGNSVEVLSTWGVDTCQDWLAGWGHILDSDMVGKETDHRVILLPGDLVRVTDEEMLFKNLDDFIRYDSKPFLLGDFASDTPFGTKELIDSYGVFLLLANWFPEAWQAIQALHINRPRSEFLNIGVPELRELLKSRAFAYEQTLNMLIIKWEACRRAAQDSFFKADEKWRNEVAAMHLGTVTDDPSGRHFRGAIDQIERTERMLRMLWRELKGWNPSLGVPLFKTLLEEYERLDERSTRIRDAARIAIWAQLNR